MGEGGLVLSGGRVRFHSRLKESGGFRFLGFLYHWTPTRNGKANNLPSRSAAVEEEAMSKRFSTPGRDPVGKPAIS